jgi:hypothetical protein
MTKLMSEDITRAGLIVKGFFTKLNPGAMNARRSRLEIYL